MNASAMNSTPKHVSDPAVDAACEEAARLACRHLDGLFPGFDGGGINSNFQGQLVDVLRSMLSGQNVVGMSKLPKLVLTDASFGNPFARSEMFVVAKRLGVDYLEGPNGEPVGELFDQDRPRPRAMRVELLNDAGTRFLAPASQRPIEEHASLTWFVPASEDSIDPFTSYDAAVKGAMKWIEATGASRDEVDQLMVIPVAFGPEKGFILNPDARPIPSSAPAVEV